MRLGDSISVIDDDADVRVSVGDLLRSVGYDVELFDCADAFLSDEPRDPPACILSDVQMPGLSGVALLRLLREQGNDTPFLLFTAYPTPLLRDQAARLGAGELIAKPFDPDALLERISTYATPAG